MGLHRSNVQIFAGFSGTGKSSYVVNSYVMAILDAGESITIIANEMNIDAWRHLFLATVLSQKLNYFGLTRKKQKTGSYTDEQLAMIKEAQKYITENYKGRIKFVKIFDYSIDDVKRVIRKMAKRGFNYNIFDTFKSEDASSSNVTGELIEASKQLLQVAEKENVNITITMQLAIYMENTRYLTSATLSSAKAVKEVVSEVILMRKLWDDEYSGQKYDVKPWRYIRDSNGKITGSKEYLTLDPEKRYRIMFLDKTRNDDDDICVISRFDGAWNSWKEIGYCTPMHQNR
nr:DnaB-like helicase C-terminal domain-containing protein [Lysinibacillus sp. Bpr_S20]